MTRTLFDRFPAHIVTFVSQRPRDFKLPNMPPFIVAAQMEYLSSALGIPIKRIVNVRQVHGCHVVVVQERDNPIADALLEADGLVTSCLDTALVVRTADCLPVFIYDKRLQCIGLAHAGWRGSQAGVVVRVLETMRREWGSKSEDCLIGFGPAIQACCYSVGEEFRDIFPQEITVRQGQGFLDLPLVNENQLLCCGVKKENIFDCGICTCCHEEYFSYRRQGGRAGRNLSLIMAQDIRK